MSEADKMFEELGYTKTEDNEETVIYMKSSFFDELIEIVFDKENGLLNVRRTDTKNYQIITSIINMQELQAINKKIEELGCQKVI